MQKDYSGEGANYTVEVFWVKLRHGNFIEDTVLYPYAIYDIRFV